MELKARGALSDSDQHLVAVVVEWEAFAAAKGFSITKGARGLPSLRGEVDGVHVELHIEFAGGSPHTRVSARVMGLRSCVVAVRPADGVVVESIREWFGNANARISDDAFDAYFLVESSPEEAARELLDEPIRRLITAFAKRELDAFAYRDGEAQVQWSLAESSPIALDAALTLVVLAAQWGSRGSPFR